MLQAGFYWYWWCCLAILSIQPKYMGFHLQDYYACCYHCTYGLDFLLPQSWVSLTKTEDDTELKEEFAAQEEASEGLHHILLLQRLLLNQQRLLAHLLAKLNHLAKPQTQSFHQV